MPRTAKPITSSSEGRYFFHNLVFITNSVQCVLDVVGDGKISMSLFSCSPGSIQGYTPYDIREGMMTKVCDSLKQKGYNVTVPTEKPDPDEPYCILTPDSKKSMPQVTEDVKDAVKSYNAQIATLVKSVSQDKKHMQETIEKILLEKGLLAIERPFKDGLPLVLLSHSAIEEYSHDSSTSVAERKTGADTLKGVAELMWKDLLKNNECESFPKALNKAKKLCGKDDENANRLIEFLHPIIQEAASKSYAAVLATAR